MSEPSTSFGTKRRALPAVVTALALAVLLYVQQVLSALLGWLGLVGIFALHSEASPSEGLVPTDIPLTLDLLALFYYVVPMALGVFLALRLLVPISRELTLRVVLIRAGIASVAAAVMYLLAGSLLALLAGFYTSIGPMPYYGIWSRATLVQNLFASVTGAIQVWIHIVPLVMFAGVLLWLWLRDPKREAAGPIDEV